MPTCLLLRHGRTTANASGVLAGWSPDVHLDEAGRAGAHDAARRILAATKPALVVSSPLTRCAETAEPLHNGGEVTYREDAELGECQYGAWTGRKIADLTKEPLWQTVQVQPSAVTFPASPDFPHESMAHMQARAVAAIRRIDQEVAETHGGGATWVAVSHGDVIKAILADALGTHLDNFQRIVVSPASISAIRYSEHRPYVLRYNDCGGDLGDILTSGTTTGRDATVGGSAI